MVKHRFSVLVAALATLAATAAFAANPGDDRYEAGGAVYTMTNAATGNAVLVFDREIDGRLTPAGSVSTGGNGTGAGLGNQSGVVLSGNERWLATVNAGSNSVALLEVRRRGLRLADVVSSGGVTPISVTEHHGLVYVVHSGSSSIAGFEIERGRLRPLPGSQRGLSTTGVGPAQIGFTPDGRHLIVTEKATNQIVSFAIDRDGLPGDAVVQPASGVTPFGFAFGKRDLLVVTEAFGGAADGSATSSYRVERDGALTTVSGSAATAQTAACWAAVTPDGRYAYVTNAGSGSITGYRVAFDGSLRRLDASGRTAVTGAGSTPLDMVVTDNGRMLYVLTGGSHAITPFRIGRDGSLTPLSGGATVPAGVNGLAVR